MLHFLLAPAIVSAIAVGDTSNSFQSGDALLAQCTDTTAAKSLELLLCVAYIEGVSDLMESDRVRAGQKPCMPAGAIGQQAIDVTVRFLQQHPELRHQSTSTVKP